MEHLANAREFQCCREITQASHILTFDGSIERISCVTQHTDYAAMTNREVLKQVVLLLRDKSGRTCHRHGNQTEKFSQTLIVSYKAIVLLPHFS